MLKRMWLLLVIMIIPAIACTLTSRNDDRSTVPTLQTGPNSNFSTPTATSIGDVPGVTPSPTPTTTPSTGNTNTGNNTTGGRPAFSDLSFSTTAAGANITAFPNGTKDVYLRWNYSNIPVGTLMTREWFREGLSVASNQESWSSNWGASGRLTHIHLFDYTNGLTAGNYYVVVKLPSLGLQIDGRFTISATSPTFTNLLFSAQENGTATTTFPYGTEQVYARWAFSNVPTGAVVRREWYRNGTLYIQREEVWQYGFGPGTVTNVRTYDFTSGYGLGAGNYRVLIYLRDFPSARLEGTFTIEGNLGPRLSNLRFATTSNGTPATSFPFGTQEVFALFDYSSIPLRAEMRRIWKRDGAVVADRQELWDFNKYGTTGTVRDVSLFDRVSGLPGGTYTVEIQIVGQSGVVVTGTFTVGQTPPPPPPTDPTFKNLTFGTSSSSPAVSNFPAGTTQVYARWEFTNVPNGSVLSASWLYGSGLIHSENVPWTAGTNGSTFLSFTSPTPLSAGTWTFRADLMVGGTSKTFVSNTFTIAQPTGNPQISGLYVSSAKGGGPETTFPHFIGNLYASFDFANIPYGVAIRAHIFSPDNGTNVELTGSWTYTNTGKVTDVWIGNPGGPLHPGSYTLTITFPEYAITAQTSFTIMNPPDGPFDPLTVKYYVPPQLDALLPQPVPNPDGIWETYISQ